MSQAHLYAASYEIEAVCTWSDWAPAWKELNDAERSKVTPIGKITRIQFNPDTSPEDSYGKSTYPQGHEGEVSLVFRVDFNSDFDNETRYYMKYGTTDSYGEQTWKGKFIEAAPGPVTRIEYKPV